MKDTPAQESGEPGQGGPKGRGDVVKMAQRGEGCGIRQRLSAGAKSK